jgi:hypothetical protein
MLGAQQSALGSSVDHKPHTSTVFDLGRNPTIKTHLHNHITRSWRVLSGALQALLYLPLSRSPIATSLACIAIILETRDSDGWSFCDWLMVLYFCLRHLQRHSDVRCLVLEASTSPSTSFCRQIGVQANQVHTPNSSRVRICGGGEKGE